jgi:Fe-S oxidoreductase
MSLKDYHYEMSHCHRCSYCKFMPFQLTKSLRFSNNCPSIGFRNFHAYSAGGRVILGHSLVTGRLQEYTETMKQIVFECTLCGACQIQCRTYNYNLNPLEVMQELRSHFVEQGEFVLEHMMMIEGLKREDNVFGEPKKNRGDWAEGLEVKDINREPADVLFHAGCRVSYDEDFRDMARRAVTILKRAGVDLGIAGKSEACCGGRAHETGFSGEMGRFAEDLLSRVKSCGATKLVTLCADCYGTFKGSYPLIGRKLEVEVLHITEVLDRLVREGRIQFTHPVPMRVTYHDPCRLGRRSEAGEPWAGEYRRLQPHIYAPVPEKPIRLGLNGCYDPPRNVLKAIPGLELVEMERNRIHSFCCGAGAGALEAFEDFSTHTATERIEEARSTKAIALVTACPWCERMFKDTVARNQTDLSIFDVVELVDQAMGGE